MRALQERGLMSSLAVTLCLCGVRHLQSSCDPQVRLGAAQDADREAEPLADLERHGALVRALKREIGQRLISCISTVPLR